MLQIFLFYLFIFISLINIVHFGLYLVGANYYDFLHFRRASRPAKRNRGLRPLVSVLIPAHNEEGSIIRSLESIRKSSHRKLEVIVIDDGSTDATRQVVRQYIKAHPKFNLRLMFKRNNVGKGSALNHALKRGVHGEFVMTLDADSLIAKRTIANAVKYFDNPKVVGVAANVRVIEATTILGLLQQFEYMIGYRSKKFFTVSNSEFIVGGVASTYRMSTLKKVGFYDHDIITEDIALSLKVIAQGNKENRVVYGYNVVAMTEGIRTFKALLKQRYRWKLGNLQSIIKYRRLFAARNKSYSLMLTWYRIPMAFVGEILLIFEPFIIGYVIYLCFLLGNLSLFIGSYMTITIYLLWNILPDEHMNWTKKLKMGTYAPVMYFIMYVMNIVQVAAVLRCMINYRKVLRKTKSSSTWQSPERHVEPQVAGL